MRESSAYFPDWCKFGALLVDRHTACSAEILSSEQSSRPIRSCLRVPVEVCRPIAVRFFGDAGEPVYDWIPADILDVSHGGLCLLVVEDADLPIAKPMNLGLDVRSHPEFGADILYGELRWFVRSGFALSFGVGFHAPLIAVPPLGPDLG